MANGKEQTAPLGGNVDNDDDDDDETVVATLPEDFDFVARPIVDMLEPATLPDKLKSKYSDEERDKIKKLYEAGKIKREMRAVKISAKKLNQKDPEFWPFWAYIPNSAAEATVMSNNLSRPRPWPYLTEKEKAALTPVKKKLDSTWGLVDHWAYGFYLNWTTPIRAMLNDAAGGPEKEIKKQVALALKGGFFDNEVEAREFVMIQRAKKAKKIADALEAAASAAQQPAQ